MQKDKITLPFGKHVSKRSCSSKQLIVRLSSETWLNKGSYWVKSFNFPLSDFVRLELLLLLSKGGPVKKDKFVTCSWHDFTKSESTNFLLFSYSSIEIKRCIYNFIFTKIRHFAATWKQETFREKNGRFGIRENVSRTG